MGMRGPRSNRELISRHPPIDHSITPRAITIYRQMRKLDLSEGRVQTNGGHRALNAELHLMAFPVYERPDWEHDYKPQESALRRFHELERASRKSQSVVSFISGNLTNSVVSVRAAVQSKV